MKTLSSRLALVLVILPLVVGATLACGKKGPPLPPLRYNPVAATDLSVRQQGAELLLTLAYPTTTIAGLALPGLESVEIWRLLRPVVVGATLTPADPREFAGTAEKVSTLRAAELEAATVGDRLQARQRVDAAATAAASAASALTFAVRTVALGGDRSEFSNLVTIVPAPPPAPPADVRVAAQADGVLVSWSPVPGVPGFRVYRRDAAIRGYREPLTATDAAVTSFLDTSARYGQRYVYAVTTVTSLEPAIESALDRESEVDYQDRFGPPAPTGLLTLPEGSDVRLRWNASAGSDVVGYIVFRQDPGGEFHRVNSQPAPSLEWLDSGLLPGNRFRYRVIAVDQLGNEGEPSAEAEAVTR
jgi:hypothetical protein